MNRPLYRVAKAEKTQISRAKTLKQACFSALTGVILILNASLNAWAYSNDEIANAIYRAEGGSKTSHPYGILAHYKTTTPRQACLNTIAHARRDWNGEGDFVSFLGSRYAPLNVANDPTGLNRNWISNVKYFLAKGA